MLNKFKHIFVLPKKVSDKEKDEILESFINGLTIKDISNKFNFSSVTISRQLKNIMGEKEFNAVKLSNNSKKEKIIEDSDDKKYKVNKKIDNNKVYLEDSFFELVPISSGIEFEQQKELSSEPLKDTNLPKVVYMLVDKKNELMPKSLRDYSEWSFMPEDDLQRMTLEIFSEQSLAKKACSNNTKILKIPNSNVFLKAAKSLSLKGISRIIYDDLLLSF